VRELLVEVSCDEPSGTVFNMFSKKSDQHSLPTPDSTAIAEAKNHPGGWVYVMDGIDNPNDAVPPERIKGAWKVNQYGEIVGDFIPNTNYLPLDSSNT
jgi:hypothetical protein